MRTALATKAVNTWTCIKLQHIALLCGLAIAASAVAVLASQEASTPRAVLNPVQQVAGQSSRALGPEFLHIYVFDSQQDANTFASGVSSETATVMTASIQTVVMATPEQESSFTLSTRELIDARVPFQVIDRRTGVGSGVYLGPGSEYYSESYAAIGPVAP